MSYPSGHTSYFEDPDGDTLTITSSSSLPGLFTITQNDPVRLRANHPADTWATITTRATDPGGLYVDFTWKYKMTCTTSGSSLSVNENSAAGTKVGNAGKYNSGGSNYTIEGDAANAFTISNGEVKVKSGATLDYETKTSYSGTVRYDVVKDGTTYKSHRAVTISINNVGGPSMSAPTVSRNATTPTTKLDISWTAANSTHPKGVTDYDVRYTQTGGSWADHAFTGTTTSTERPGLTAGKKYEVQARATDGEGTGAWSSSGEAITQYTSQTRSIVENSAAGTNVGAAVDADSNPNGYTLSYSLGGTDASSFSINSSSGQITVGTNTDLDYETKTSYSVIVTMTASAGSVTSTGNTGLSPNGTGDYIIPVTINITDVDETPRFPSDTTTRSIAENSAAGTNVGSAVTATDAENETLYYSLTGTDASKFEIGLNTGQITVKSGASLDYESGVTSYSVTANVSDRNDESGNNNTTTDDTIAVTINVTDVNEPPPKMAAPTVTKHSTTPKTKLDAAWTALSTSSMAGKPAVSDYDVRYRLHGATGAKSWTDASFTGLGLSTTLSGLTSHKSYEVQVRAVNAEGNGPWSDSGSAITDGDGVTRSIAENSAAGTNVGAAVTATSNPNNYTLTHTLSGTDASDFTIATSTGQIKVKSALDYETKSSYSVTVTVKAAAAQVQVQSLTLAPNNPGDYVVPVTINVTDVNEPPTFPDATTTRSVAENSAGGTNVGAVITATDPDGDTLYYGLSFHGNIFTINQTTGQIQVKNGANLNHEGVSSYANSVFVLDKKDDDGKADNVADAFITLTINITDVNEPPPKMAAPTVTKNSSAPKTKLDAAWVALTSTQMAGKPGVSDYDVQYRKHGDSSWTDASFTGLNTSTTLSGLTSHKSYEVQVRANNDEGSGPWSDSGSAITDGGGVTRSVAENSTAGTNIGAAVTASKNDNNYTLTHTLGGTDASDFAIATSTGQIKVKSALNYESKKQYSVTVTVKAASAGGASIQSLTLAPNNPGDYTVPVTINVTDVNEPPSFADDTATRSVAENSAAGTNIGAVVTASDPDSVAKFNTLTYSLSGTDAGKFDINGSTGQISVKAGHIPNYEAKTSYSVTVQVSDGKNAGGSADTTVDDTIAVTINVTDVNEPPAKLAAPSVARSSTSPTSKLGLSWTVPDMTGKPPITDYDVRYRVATTSASASWSSLTHTGTSTSATLANLTANKTYEAQVRAKNDEGTGAWSDSGRNNTRGGGITRSVAENSSAGTNVGAAVTATSNPNGYSLTHSLSGTDASSFSIVASSGQIRVKSALDYESKKQYSVVVTVKAAMAGAQSQSLSPNWPGNYTVPVTIMVTDVNEAPTFTEGATTTRGVAENVVANTDIGASVTATDPDGDTLSYSLSGTDSASFSLDTSTGQIKTKAALDYEAKNSYSVTVGVSDGSLSDTIAVTVVVTDVNEPPAKPDAPTPTQNDDDPKTKLDVSWTAPDMTGKPAITDYDLRYRQTSTSSATTTAAWTLHSMGTTTATSTTLSGLEGGRGYEAQVLARNHEGDSPWSDSGKAKTEDKNIDSETTVPTTTRSIAENSARGTDIGDPVTGVDNENDTLEYRLGGTDAADFAIASSTGQIMVKSALNYEGKSLYSVVVEVNDGKDSENRPDTSTDATTEVDIIVTDALEPPPAPDAPTVTRNSASPESSLNVTWDEPDMTGRPPVTDYDLRYMEKDGSGWTVSLFVGLSRRDTLTNLSEDTWHYVQVRAYNDEGVGPWSPSGRQLTGVDNGAPTFPDGATTTRSVAENSAAGTNVGAPVSATDPDGDALSYKLSGTDAARFEIDTSTGQIAVGVGTSLNFEAKATYSVNVEVNDGKSKKGKADTSTDAIIRVDINVTDVNEPPSRPDAPTVTLSGTELSVDWKLRT